MKTLSWKTQVWVWTGLVGLAIPLGAQAAIYKCTRDNMVVYQDTPCDRGAASQLIVASLNTGPAGNRFERIPAATLAEPAPESAPRAIPHLPGLTLGMLDTEVLNLRGWGRPGKITRSKASGTWREAWTYFSLQDGQRQLQFANGKLTGIL